MTKDNMYDMLAMITSTDALDLAFGIKGYTEETAKAILFYLTGYNDFEQFLEEETEEEEIIF